MTPIDDVIGSALFDIGTAITRLFDALEDEKDRDELVRLYRALDWTVDDPRGLTQQLVMVRDEVVTKLAGMVTFDEQVIVEGVGLPLIRSTKGGTSRTDWSPLLARVVGKTADEFTGEPPAVFAEKVVNLTAACIGTPPSRTPNKGGCRQLGVEPDQFISKTSTRPSVRWQTK